ncbi:MAG: glycerol-3-phosphate 1-O-acyltransferase PlsY [Terriglobales bacterium]
MPAAALILLLAFLLGTIPFGYLLFRWRRGGDIRRTGSGNIGATNVLRTGGKGLGAATLVLDAAKGWVALEVALHGPVAGWVGAGALVAVVLGHVCTPWLRGRGGKGVATALGAFVALAPWALLATVGVFALVLAWRRYVSLASICACVALPLWLVTPLQPGPFSPANEVAAVIVAAIIIARHRANLERLRRGTECKIGQKLGAQA